MEANIHSTVEGSDKCLKAEHLNDEVVVFPWIK